MEGRLGDGALVRPRLGRYRVAPVGNQGQDR